MKKVLYCVLSILITYVLQVSAFTYLEIAGIRWEAEWDFLRDFLRDFYLT